MLDRAGIAMGGKHAVVIGRSNIVGRPLALLQNSAGASTHARTSFNFAELKDSSTLDWTASELQSRDSW